MIKRILSLCTAAVMCFGGAASSVAAAAPKADRAEHFYYTNGTRIMTLDDVRELSKRGTELTWDEVDEYRGEDISTDTYEYEYDLGDGYFLRMGGYPWEKPYFVILCFCDTSISIDIREEDVDAFIEKTSGDYTPEMDYTFDEIYSMTTGEVEDVFEEKGLAGKNFYEVFRQDITAASWEDLPFRVLLYPENYLFDLKGLGLVTKVDSDSEQDKLFDPCEAAWKSRTVLKSLGLPEEHFIVDVGTSDAIGGVGPANPDEYAVRRYCQCMIISKESDPVESANLMNAARNYVQLNPDFALFLSDPISATVDDEQTSGDGAYTMGNGWVRFNGDIDTAWVLTNSSFDDFLSDEDYRFYTEYMGKYVILTGKYNVDVNELLEHPDMSEVECRLKSYVVSNLGGSVLVNEGSEYILRSPDIEAMENITAEREQIYTAARNVLDSDLFFRYIRIKGADSTDPEHRAYMTPALNIFASSEAQLSCTIPYPAGGTKTYVLKPEAEAEGLKRYEVKGSNSGGFGISEGRNDIEVTAAENGIYTSYELKETNGDIEPSSLKIRTYRKGDLNGDGRINIADAVILQSWLLGAGNKQLENWNAADICEDGEINVFDMTALRRLLLEGIAESKEKKPPVSALSPTLPSVGKNRIPVFAVEFPDCTFDEDDVAGKIETACFGSEDKESASYPYESISAYLERSSYGELRLTGDVFCYTAKHTSDSYAGSNGVGLVEEVLAAFDGKLDYNTYDSNGDKILDSMMMILPNNAGKADGDGDGIPDWWPFSVKYYGYESYDGVKPGTYCAGAFAASDRAGIVRKMTHELCHAMGLPDYYRTAEKYDNEAMLGEAGYELMDEGFGDLSAFSKLMLGWLKDEDIYVYDGGSREYSITSMQQDPACVIIPRYKDSGFLSEFFIVEYTTGEGNNSPTRNGTNELFNMGGGVRVMHCQAEVSQGQYGMEFSYSNNGALYDKSGDKERVLRLISGSDLVSSYNSTEKFIDPGNPGFRWYDSSGEQTVSPGVSIRVGGINYGPDFDLFGSMSYSGNIWDMSDAVRGSSYTIEVSQQ